MGNGGWAVWIGLALLLSGAAFHKEQHAAPVARATMTEPAGLPGLVPAIHAPGAPHPVSQLPKV
ncbi:MAG: hypothetical protein AB7O57_13220 [Hyphomicrobiaceae bacterium]